MATVWVTRPDRERARGRGESGGRKRSGEGGGRRVHLMDSFMMDHEAHREHPDVGGELGCDGEYRGLHYCLNH